MYRKGEILVDQDGQEWFMLTDPDPVTGEFKCVSEHGRGTGNVNVVVTKDPE